jgi:hypothetical protein
MTAEEARIDPRIRDSAVASAPPMSSTPRGTPEQKMERKRAIGEGLFMDGPAEATQDVRRERASLLRDFVFEALAPVESDAAAARLCLKNDDDAGARYHLKRVVECVKAAASAFREFESLIGREG